MDSSMTPQEALESLIDCAYSELACLEDADHYVNRQWERELKDALDVIGECTLVLTEDYINS